MNDEYPLMALAPVLRSVRAAVRACGAVVVR